MAETPYFNVLSGLMGYSFGVMIGFSGVQSEYISEDTINGFYLDNFRFLSLHVWFKDRCH
jgi:hypothetical protein